MKEQHKYSLKRLKTETHELSISTGSNITVEETAEGVVFRNAWGKPWQSVPMTVEEAKYFLFGYRQAKGGNNVTTTTSQRAQNRASQDVH